MSIIDLSELLSVGCGGKADVEFVHNASLMKLEKGDIIIGRGTNILASDGGVRGRVLVMRDNHIHISGNRLYAACGASLPMVTRAAAECGLSGLEWASGIPGSLGGGIFMNAGAYGSEIGEYIGYVDVMTEDGAERVKANALTFAYRQTVGLNGVVTGAELRLKQADKSAVYAKMREYSEKRRTSQPGGRTFGSVFKRSGGVSAGYYIEKAGLKGRRHGGAIISPVHANFIINEGKATAQDVRSLIDLAKLEVYRQFGVRLEEEVKYLGEF